MQDKRKSRIRRAAKTRIKIRQAGATRLCINRTSQHTYAQVISADGSSVLASASTLEKDIRGQVKHGANIEAAKVIGKVIAERATKAGIEQVAFDRSGFKYHGRVQALADAARENGLKC